VASRRCCWQLLIGERLRRWLAFLLLLCVFSSSLFLFFSVFLLLVASISCLSFLLVFLIVAAVVGGLTVVPCGDAGGGMAVLLPLQPVFTAICFLHSVEVPLFSVLFFSSSSFKLTYGGCCC